MTESLLQERRRLARGMIDAVQDGDSDATRAWARAYLGTDRPTVDELVALPWHVSEFHSDEDRSMRTIAKNIMEETK